MKTIHEDIYHDKLVVEANGRVDSVCIKGKESLGRIGWYGVFSPMEARKIADSLLKIADEIEGVKSEITLR